jgi:hypothetical protein
MPDIRHRASIFFLPSSLFNQIRGFAPAVEALLFRQKDPKPFPPRSTTFNRADVGNGGTAQLAGLRQGPPLGLSVSPVSRPAGGGEVGPLHIFCKPLSLFSYIRRKDVFLITTGGKDEEPSRVPLRQKQLLLKTATVIEMS